MSLRGLSLRDLEYLVAVAGHGHFGRAADACRVNQPSLSAGVRKIEEMLGYRVFERASRKVLVTRKGNAAVSRERSVIGAARRFLAGDTMGGLVRYRSFSDPRIGRTVALAWRRSRGEDGDVRALLDLLCHVRPPGALALQGADGRYRVTEGFDKPARGEDNRAVQSGSAP